MINGYSIFNGAKYFAEDGSQNYFLFQLLIKYFKSSTINMFMTWKSKGLSDEKIKPLPTSDIALIPS